MDKDTNKTPGQLYHERLKRVDDAVALKVPDRVPVICDFGLLPARYVGMSIKDAYYEPEKLAAATKKIVMDLEPDIFHSIMFLAGSVWEILDTKVMKWPGHGGPIDHVNQYVEWEFMKADEYDVFLQDPVDFILRAHLPRTCGALAAFQKLPHLGQLLYVDRGGGPLVSFADPEIWAAFETLHKAGLELQRWLSIRMAFVEEMEKLGFPSMYIPPLVQVPFDNISDHLRGLHGSMLDMYRQPDKLHKAIEKLMPVMLSIIKDWAALIKSRPHAVQWAPWGPHRGADPFMSKKQYEEFYWPWLKSLIQAIIAEGITPYMFWEGDITSRLEHLLELPKGKMICRFDVTDIFKAKEILGGHHCIAGGVSSAMLQTATVQEVKDHCKKLIDVVGKDGGYIMHHSCALDEAKPENVKAMIDTCKEYGVYN